MRCPSCEARLVEIDRSDVLVDACPQCRGVWLERGELDKILVRERQLAGGNADEDFFREVEGRRPTPPQRTDESGGHGGEQGSGRKRKRRSLLEDLLDFD